MRGAGWARFARGRLASGKRSGLEDRYQRELEARRSVGEIVWFKYEALKFRLGDGAYFTPDFVVMLADGTIECHEVKGFWREAARARIKIAAEMYPFRFISITHNAREGWKVEEF